MMTTQDPSWPIPPDERYEQDEDDAGWPVPVDAFLVLPTDYAELPQITARRGGERQT